MRGRGRLAQAAVSTPLRPGRAPGRESRPGGRRRVRDGDVRGRRSRSRRCAPSARGEARLRSGVRARAALRPVRRNARGVPGSGIGAGARAQSRSDARPSEGDDHRRSKRLPRRDRASVGAVGAACARAHESGAAAQAGRAGAARARNLRLRRPAHPAEGPRRRDRSRRPRPRSEARRRRGRARASRARARGGLLGGCFPCPLPRSANPRRDPAHRRRRRGGPPLERLGEPAALGGGGAVGRCARGVDRRRWSAGGRDRR